MTTTTRRHYDTLTWREKQHIRDYIRMIWIEDAIAELRQYPEDDGLAETLRNLANNTEAAWDLINEQLDDTNPMYIEACGVHGIRIQTEDEELEEQDDEPLPFWNDDEDIEL